MTRVDAQVMVHRLSIDPSMHQKRRAFNHAGNEIIAEQDMEVYVDDTLVKSRKASHHVDDLTEAFGVLRNIK
ncbi:unnamed protein product [Citrullus colocynthis]|uniref:Uncharacterized protein n=1 Tax=Citrullus colocynthis TaxID=252529 RepID=A0ABP0YWW6_9ROSI